MCRLRASLRPLNAAILVVALLASPVLSAESCPGACAAAKAAIDDGCCLSTAGHSTELSHAPVAGERTERGCHHCTTPCCRPLVATNDHAGPVVGDVPGARVQPLPLSVPERITHHVIFHPPKA